MIIPRQYFQRPQGQTQMMQAPQTQVPQGETDFGANKATATLFENLEGVFAKLGPVAAKIQKSNEDLEFQEQKQSMEEQMDLDYESWRFDELPNYGFEKLNHTSVRDYFLGQSDGHTGPWSKEIKYSDSDRLNRKLKNHAKAYQSKMIKQAIGATMQERTDRINVLINTEVKRLADDAMQRVLTGQDVDVKTYTADFQNTFGPLKNDGAVGKQVYNSKLRILADKVQRTRAIVAFRNNPKVWARKTFKSVQASFPGADPLELFDQWHMHAETDKKAAYDSLVELIDNPNVLPSDISDRLNETTPAYSIQSAENKEKLHTALKNKNTNYLQNRELLRLEVNLKNSSVFRSLVKVDNGNTIVDLDAVKKLFKNDQRLKSAIGIVQQYIQSEESLKQRRALEETGKIENVLNKDNWDYNTVLGRINGNSDMEELDKIRLRGFLGNKNQLRNNQKSSRYLSNFLSDEANQQTFLETYEKVVDKNTAKVISDDDLGELAENELVQNFKLASPGDLQSFYLQAKGDFKETARQGTLASFRKNLSLVTSSSGVQKMIEGLEKRPESIRFADHQDQLATLNGLKLSFEQKEKATEDRKILEGQELLQLKQRNQIQQTKNSKSLMTEDDINGLDLTEFQKEYLRGIRGLKQIELDAKFENQQDAENFQKIIQKALEAETIEDFQIAKAQVETLIQDRVNAEELNTTLQRMETGLKDRIETKESNQNAKQQNVNYTGLEQAIRNVTDQQGIDSVRRSLDILKVTDDDKGDVTRVQQLLLEGSLKATQDNLTDRLSQPDNDADSAFSGRISELADQATHSNQMGGIMEQLNEREDLFPDGKVPGWFYRLRSGVKTRRRQLRTKEQSDSLVNFAHNKWEKYRAIRSQKDGYEKLREKYPLMKRDDFAQSDRIADNQWDLATPNYITSSVDLGNHLTNYSHWLQTKIFNPDTEQGNPLLQKDNEGQTLETRLGANIVTFDDLNEYAYEVSKGLKEAILLPTDVAVQDVIDNLFKNAKGDENKLTVFNPFENIAKARIERLQKEPNATAVDDALLKLEAGQVHDEKNIQQSKFYQTQRVIDGDTLIIGDQRIRLANVDTPELGTPEGEKAAKAVTDLLSKSKIRLEIFGKGQYGRSLAYVWIDEKIMLQEWLIRNGYSGYMKHFGAGKHSQQLEQAASGQ